MPTLFSQIIARKIPAHIIAEDEKHIAFLDIHPLAEGHTLVVPKKAEDYLFTMETSRFQALMSFGKQVAHLLEKSIPCDRIGLLALGLEVPHVHLHLVPLHAQASIDQTLPRLQVSQEQLQQVAAHIRQQDQSPS